MDICIKPSKLKGTLDIPASKSIMHRSLICAALCDGSSTIHNSYISDDIKATMNCLENLGAEFEVFEDKIKVHGIKNIPQSTVLDCNESGSTIRFFIPIAMALGVNTSFLGRGKLVTRPLHTYKKALKDKSVEFNYNGTLPCNCSGKLSGGEYTIEGNVSSQFITGLLFALPLLDSDSKITVTKPFESKSYVDITVNTLKSFGIEILNQDNTYYIKGNQKYKPTDYYVESDYSQVAFFLVANAFGSNIKLKTFFEKSTQGDSAIIDILNNVGVKCTFDNNEINTKIESKKPFDVDANNIPDIVPILCVLATSLNGVSKIRNVHRLKIKESDRIASTIDIITKLGGTIFYDETSDTITIMGGLSSFSGAVLDSFNDHRIAMCSAIASTNCTGDIIIKGANCVNKSYPTFFEDLKKLGGNYNVINVD